MTLKEKLDAFKDLNEQEIAKVKKGLYIKTLYEVQDDIDNIIECLNVLGIKIKSANEIKVGTVPLNEIKEKIDNLRSVDAIDLAIQHPLVLTVNDKCLGIRKRIIKCKQDGVKFKDEDGNYLSFIYDDEEWAKKPLTSEQIIDEYDKEHPNKEFSNEEKEANLRKADEILKEINHVSEPEIPNVIDLIDNEFNLNSNNNLDEKINSTLKNDDNDTPNNEEVEKASQDLSAIEDAKKELENTKKALRDALDAQTLDMNYAPEEDASIFDWNPDELGRGGR